MLPVIKEVIDLSHELYNGMPNIGGLAIAFWPVETYEAQRTISGGKVGYESRMMLMAEHCGTHLDALRHFDEGGLSVNEVPLDRLVLPGHLLDLTHKGSYLFALQHAQHTWALVPAASSDAAPATICVPGMREDGAPLFMRERRDPGIHRFVCFEALAPWPASLWAFEHDGAGLDKRALDALAAFYRDQPAARRACHMLTVEVEAAG